MNDLKELTVYDLLETTWNSGIMPEYLGTFNGHVVSTHQFQLETEEHVNPLYVAEINMNTRFIKYALPLKMVKRTPSNGIAATLSEFYEQLRESGIQLSEDQSTILYNEEYFHYAKLKVLNQTLDKVIFEVEREILQ